MPDGDTGFYANTATAPDYDACRRDGGGLFDPAADRAATCTGNALTSLHRAGPDRARRRDLRGCRDCGGRGIAGLSMGGFGALMLAMRHPDRFSAAASHSGVDALLYLGPHPYAPGEITLVEDPGLVRPVRGPDRRAVGHDFGPDRATWEAHDRRSWPARWRPARCALPRRRHRGRLHARRRRQLPPRPARPRAASRTRLLPRPRRPRLRVLVRPRRRSLGFFAAHFTAR